MRLALARDPKFLSAVFRICTRKVLLHQRRRARMQEVDDGQGAALLFVQRFGSLLNLNPHGHGVFADGVFVEDADERLEFVPLPEPTAADMEAVGLSIVKSVLKLWHKHQEEQGFGDDDDDSMSHLSSDALSMGIKPVQSDTQPKRRKATSILIDTELGKFSFDAGTVAKKDDRAGLERLLRYGGRPPFSHKRLSLSPSGKVVYKLKRPYYTGQTEVVLEPVAFLRRLAALVPPKGQHSVRYYGLLASQAADKDKLVAMVEMEQGSDDPAKIAEGPLLESPIQGDGGALGEDDDLGKSKPVYRRAWAVLLKRVFKHDVMVCPHCDGERQIIAAVLEREAIDKILTHLGHSTQVPRMAPARAPPQMELWDDEY